MNMNCNWKRKCEKILTLIFIFDCIQNFIRIDTKGSKFWLDTSTGNLRKLYFNCLSPNIWVEGTRSLKQKSFHFQLNHRQRPLLLAVNNLSFLFLLVNWLLKLIFSLKNSFFMYAVELLHDLVHKHKSEK